MHKMKNWVLSLGRRKMRKIMNGVQYLIGVGIGSFFMGICVAAIRNSIENGYENYGNVIATTIVTLAIVLLGMVYIGKHCDKYSADFVRSLYESTDSRECRAKMKSASSRNGARYINDTFNKTMLTNVRQYRR